jgi:hypothetical protein
MYRTRLVPRAIAVLGFVGGSLIFVSPLAVMFGFYEQLSTTGVIAALPVFAWEVSLAVYLIAKGCKPPIGTHNAPSTEPAVALSQT